MSKKSRLQIVEIEFIDLQSGAGWFEHNQKEFHKKNEIPLLAIGFLVARDKKWITIAHCKNPHGEDWLGEFSLPMAIVKKVRTVGYRNLAQ